VEIIEHEEGIEQGDLGVPESPSQMDASPFDGRLALPDLADLAHGFHTLLLREIFSVSFYPETRQSPYTIFYGSGTFGWVNGARTVFLGG
jgi:hypothetical protein